MGIWGKYVGIDFKNVDFSGIRWKYIVSGIYKIQNDLNGKVYIGESVHVRRRWVNHIAKSKRYSKTKGKKLTNVMRALSKYGVENFTFTIIEEENDDYQRKYKEKIYIEEYKATDRNYGYNINKGYVGGMQGKVLDEEDVNNLKKIIRGNKYTFKDIAEMFGIHITTVIRVNNGESYKEESTEYPIRSKVESKQIALGMEEVQTTCNICRGTGNIVRKGKVYCTEDCYNTYKEHNKKEVKLRRSSVEYKCELNRVKENKKVKSSKSVGIKKPMCKECGKDITKKVIDKYEGMCSICYTENNLKHGKIRINGNNFVFIEELWRKLHKNSFTEVGDIYGVSDNAVRKWCKKFGMPTKAKFYKTEEKDTRFSNKMSKIVKEGDRNKVPIRQFDLDDNFVREYGSIRQASKITGINGSNIMHASRGYAEVGKNRLTAGGFKWERIEDG